MKIRFWGVRGSIPAPGPETIRYGGNTSCMEIVGADEPMICDMGSGLRCLSEQIMRSRGPDRPQTYNFFMSHAHWDHIMGFPFFMPAYIPGNIIRIHGSHPLSVLQEGFHRQHSSPCFPVPWERLGADIRFIHLDPGRWYEINGLRIKSQLQPHPGYSCGYRFEKDGKTFVYSTDGEYKLDSDAETSAMVEFYHGADLVIFDAMYSLKEAIHDKSDWGHSSNVIGVDICLRAAVRHLCMFHHEPAHNDDAIHAILKETRRYAEIAGEGRKLTVSSAYDGLTLDL